MDERKEKENMKTSKTNKGEMLKKRERVILLAIKGWTSQITLFLLKRLGLGRMNMNHHTHYVVKPSNNSPTNKAEVNILNPYKSERGCEHAWLT